MVWCGNGCVCHTTSSVANIRIFIVISGYVVCGSCKDGILSEGCFLWKGNVM